MKHIVNYSGGLCSFWTLVRSIEEHGKENVIPLFADVLMEHRDLYAFNAAVERLLGVQIVRVSRELTPWQLFRLEGLIANDQFPICSVKLKRELLNAWMEAHYELCDGQENMFKEKAVVVLGMDFSEWNRVEDFQKQHPTWAVEAPMTEPPLWDKCKMRLEAEKLGLPAQTLYKLGFPHNNCGGGCVKAGISQFVLLYHTQRETFDMWEREEQETLAEFARRGVSNGHFTILKDRRGGKSKPLSLTQLRARIEAGEKLPTKEWGGCGCGVSSL